MLDHIEKFNSTGSNWDANSKQDRLSPNKIKRSNTEKLYCSLLDFDEKSGFMQSKWNRLSNIESTPLENWKCYQFTLILVDFDNSVFVCRQCFTSFDRHPSYTNLFIQRERTDENIAWTLLHGIIQEKVWKSE